MMRLYLAVGFVIAVIELNGCLRRDPGEEWPALNTTLLVMFMVVLWPFVIVLWIHRAREVS